MFKESRPTPTRFPKQHQLRPGGILRYASAGPALLLIGWLVAAARPRHLPVRFGWLAVGSGVVLLYIYVGRLFDFVRPASTISECAPVLYGLVLFPAVSVAREPARVAARFPSTNDLMHERRQSDTGYVEEKREHTSSRLIGLANQANLPPPSGFRSSFDSPIQAIRSTPDIAARDAMARGDGGDEMAGLGWCVPRWPPSAFWWVFWGE